VTIDAPSRPGTRPGTRPAPRRTPPPVPRIGTRRPVRNPPRRPGRQRPRGLPVARSAGRLRLAVVGVLGLLLVLGGRLVQLQGLESTAYASRAEAQRIRTIVLPASRGAITDRSGHTLARDLDLRLVFGDPSEAAHDAEGTAAQLAPLLGLPAQTLAAQLRTPGTAYVPLKHLVEVPIAEQIDKLRLPGIGTVRESQRAHPAGDVAAALVGLVGTDGKGLSGAEAKADDLLRGRAGTSTEERDYAGRIIPSGVHTEVPAVDGSDVRLTVDRDLQWYAQQVLARQVAAAGARGGQVVVEDVHTGEVYALASAPSLDPTKPVKDPGALAIPSLSTSYEPGSVGKVITAAAALDARVVQPTSPFVINDTYSVPGRGSLLIDAERHGLEHLTFTGVLAKSSNIGTVQVEQRLGRTGLAAALSAFGLGQRTGTGFSAEARGLVPAVAHWNVAQETTIAFGQGMSATGMQIASVYATIANGGVRVAPQLVRGTVAPDGSVHDAAAPGSRRVVSAATAATLRAMMEQVTTKDGTAPKAAIPGVRVAGKTGTAQAVEHGGYAPGAYVASFAGFAPAEAPRFVVSVVIDHPTTGSHFGGDIAAPVFQQVMGFALREFAVVPNGSRSPVLPLCWGDRAGCSAP